MAGPVRRVRGARREGLAFAPLTDVLRALVATTTEEELDEFLGTARQELAWLLPELGDDRAPVPVASPAQFLELVLSVVVRLARERPLLLVVEDLHWADRSTLELVSFLVRAFRNARVMLLMTYRSDELHRRHPLRPCSRAGRGGGPRPGSTSAGSTAAASPTSWPPSWGRRRRPAWWTRCSSAREATRTSSRRCSAVQRGDSRATCHRPCATSC